MFSTDTSFPNPRSSWSTFGEHRSCSISLLKTLTFMFTMSREILHDPKYYSDPFAFKPERFLTTPTHESELDPSDVIFGFGRRYVNFVCPPSNMALPLTMHLFCFVLSSVCDYLASAQVCTYPLNVSLHSVHQLTYMYPFRQQSRQPPVVPCDKQDPGRLRYHQARRRQRQTHRTRHRLQRWHHQVRLGLFLFIVSNIL